MLSPKDDADLHRNAYNHAREMIVAMNTPFKVRIALTPDCSFTDSRVVSVATDMFDDWSLSVGQKIDIFTGLSVHEGSHLLYTDFALMGSARKRLVADLFNIIEDERIEMLTSDGGLRSGTLDTCKLAEVVQGVESHTCGEKPTGKRKGAFNGTFSYFDIERQDWRCFRVDTLVELDGDYVV